MIIAVDTGGTKTLVGRFSSDGALEASKKFPTPSHVSAYVAELKSTIGSLADDADIEAISVALPGTMQRGVMQTAGNLTWEHIDMHGLLRGAFSCPVYVENDANLAGLAEIRALDKRPHIGLYVTVSTGIGTGIIVDGGISRDFGPAEGGETLLEHDGKLQEWQSFASGKAIFERTKSYARDITDDQDWQRIGHDIAVGIVALSPVIRPEIIIIGGSIGTYFARYESVLRREIDENLRPGNRPHVTQATHPETAVLYGCYYYAIDERTA